MSYVCSHSFTEARDVLGVDGSVPVGDALVGGSFNSDNYQSFKESHCSQFYMNSKTNDFSYTRSTYADETVVNAYLQCLQSADPICRVRPNGPAAAGPQKGLLLVDWMQHDPLSEVSSSITPDDHHSVLPADAIQFGKTPYQISRSDSRQSAMITVTGVDGGHTQRTCVARWNPEFPAFPLTRCSRLLQNHSRGDSISCAAITPEHRYQVRFDGVIECVNVLGGFAISISAGNGSHDDVRQTFRWDCSNNDSDKQAVTVEPFSVSASTVAVEHSGSQSPIANLSIVECPANATCDILNGRITVIDLDAEPSN
jgi:hypothetical protein